MNAAQAAMTDPLGVGEVLTAFGDAGVPPDEADRVVTIESGWNPAARNSASGAVGLLQWMPETLKAMPGSPTPGFVQAMSRVGQAGLVRATFATYKRSRPGDAYLWIVAPAFFFASPSKEIYGVGSRAWQLNPGWREPGNGPVTVRRVLAIGSGAEALGGSQKSGSLGVPKTSGGATSTLLGGTGLAILLIAFLLASRK